MAVIQALENARAAWEAGQAIIANKFKPLLAKHKLQIKADDPTDRLTLERCRTRLLKELATIPGLSTDDEWKHKPTTDRNRIWSLGSCYVEFVSGNADELLKLVVEQQLSSCNWKKAEWRKRIVDPMETFCEIAAGMVRENFGRIYRPGIHRPVLAIGMVQGIWSNFAENFSTLAR